MRNRVDFSHKTKGVGKGNRDMAGGEPQKRQHWSFRRIIDFPSEKATSPLNYRRKKKQ